MKFAIIYHVYKNTTSLRESLHSIFSQVDRNFELILINDFSSIAVTNIINEFNFNELKQFTYLKYSQNLGHSYSFNNALNITTSDYVLYAGSNFIFNKNFTKIVNETIDKTSDVDVISFTNIKNDCSVQIFNKLNANMKLLLRQSMKDKIVSVKMLREHKIMLDENLYSPLVYIYQILSAFKKWVIVDFKQAEYLKNNKFTYNLYDIFEQNDYLISEYSQTKFWRSNIDLIQYFMTLYIILIFIPRIFLSYSDRQIRLKAIESARSWLSKNIPNWKNNKIFKKNKVMSKQMSEDLVGMKFKIKYITKLMKEYKI